jgi:AcrR family transcriptional regulator
VPRTKIVSDDAVLESAYRLIHEDGPEALTFANVGERCGLSPSTLVQRFKSKADLVQATLLRAWDQLDAKTAALDAAMPRSPAGAVKLLVKLSGNYGGIEAFANGLLVLREDLRDPVLRARGAKWKRVLCRALDDRLGNAPRDSGLLMAAAWQGALVWWGFDPRGDVADFVEARLKAFVTAIAARLPRS